MKIGSIAQFLNELRNIPKPRNSEIYFRGHSDCEYKLTPSIYRNKKFIFNEHNLFKEFILRTPNDFMNDKSALEKLVKMQHYGLPTRLLDITSNPLVSLYFACESTDKKDGEVVVFNIPNNDIKYFDSDTVSILSNIAKRPSDFSIETIKSFDKKEFNKKEAILYLLHEIKEEKSYFQPLIVSSDIERTVAVKVKQSNSRIIKQSGALIIFGINNEKSIPAKIPENWILNNKIGRTKKIEFIINKDQKKDLLNELNTLGINEASLFPELDNQAKYLKKKYG
ncbi:MAG TPA: FRG domain-containing protein [Macellibacteroides fermentans]|uniref:FRG domain-containing protein n=1 Tax=Macellibacteroides fermentans TaxID=879969 RepID=UPI002BC4BC10|nr:FRG domain-containing protein [Macellibacteroides fermentans]